MMWFSALVVVLYNHLRIWLSLLHILGYTVSLLTLRKYAYVLALNPTCECDIIGDKLIEDEAK